MNSDKSLMRGPAVIAFLVNDMTSSQCASAVARAIKAVDLRSEVGLIWRRSPWKSRQRAPAHGNSATPSSRQAIHPLPL